MQASNSCCWTRTASCGACCGSTLPVARRSQVCSLDTSLTSSELVQDLMPE